MQMEMMRMNLDSDMGLRTALEKLADGQVVIKNTTITIPQLFSTIAKFNLKDASHDLGIDEDRIKIILRGLSIAFEKISPHLTHYEDRIEAVSRAWCDSIGLAFSPQDRKCRSSVIRFLSMLEAAGVLEKPKKSLMSKIGDLLKYIKNSIQYRTSIEF